MSEVFENIHIDSFSIILKLVGVDRLERTMPKAPNLQSGGVTNFPTHPLCRARFYLEL